MQSAGGEAGARWQLYPETVRTMLREARLLRAFIGRRGLQSGVVAGLTGSH